MSVECQAHQVCVETFPDVIDTFVRAQGSASDRRRDLQIFLVACHQASVSVETMSTYLGLDGDTIRSELLLGIEAWNAGQRRLNEATTTTQ